MRQYGRIIVFFVVAAVVVLAIAAGRKASAPESAIIAAERDRLLHEQKQGTDEEEQDARAQKLAVLGYRLAKVYLVENEPDKAVEVLRQLIQEEQGGGTDRHARSYLNEAKYLGTLATAYELKNDRENADRTRALRQELMAKARDLKRQERRAEGKALTRIKD